MKVGDMVRADSDENDDCFGIVLGKDPNYSTTPDAWVVTWFWTSPDNRGRITQCCEWEDNLIIISKGAKQWIQ